MPDKIRLKTNNITVDNILRKLSAKLKIRTERYISIIYEKYR